MAACSLSFGEDSLPEASSMLMTFISSDSRCSTGSSSAKTSPIFIKFFQEIRHVPPFDWSRQCPVRICFSIYANEVALFRWCWRFRLFHGQRAVFRLSWDRNAVVQRTVKRDILVRTTQVHLPLTLVALPNASRKSWFQGVPRLRAQEFKVVVAAILNSEEIRRHIACGFYCDLRLHSYRRFQ
jgi:hypothetical protein